MLAFDPAELRKEGVTIAPLPDESGRIIDVSALPPAFTTRLRRSGLDTSKPVRVIGVIGRRPNGAPGHYSIFFAQA